MAALCPSPVLRKPPSATRLSGGPFLHRQGGRQPANQPLMISQLSSPATGCRQRKCGPQMTIYIISGLIYTRALDFVQLEAARRGLLRWEQEVLVVFLSWPGPPALGPLAKCSDERIQWVLSCACNCYLLTGKHNVTFPCPCWVTSCSCDRISFQL